jgi:hypothetical protein
MLDTQRFEALTRFLICTQDAIRNNTHIERHIGGVWDSGERAPEISTLHNVTLQRI